MIDPDAYKLEDDGRDGMSLWDRCQGIVERGIKKFGNSGSLPISGTGRARKKKDPDEKKLNKKIARKKK